MGTDGFSIEHNIVDLRCVEQLIDTEQTAALAAILKHIVKKRQYLHGNAGAGC